MFFLFMIPELHPYFTPACAFFVPFASPPVHFIGRFFGEADDLCR
jgi:hypothetical protein